MTNQTQSYTFPCGIDGHRHIRDNITNPRTGYVKYMLPVYINEIILGGFCGVRLMLNTSPPVSKVSGPDTKTRATLTGYKWRCEKGGIGRLEYVDYCLYLSGETTPADIEEFKKAGGISVKKYPASSHGNLTTNSHLAVPIEEHFKSGVMRAIEETGLTFCTHGEASDLPGTAYFGPRVNAESIYYTEQAPRLIDRLPNLKLFSGEHLTTAEGVNFIRQLEGRGVGTLTFQHMQHTVDLIVQHSVLGAVCAPRLKFLFDMISVWDAAFGNDNQYFCLGSDDAPHTVNAKHTLCGCANGCFGGRHVLAEYASAFEMLGPWLAIWNNLELLERYYPAEIGMLRKLPRRSFDNANDRQVWENFTCHNYNHIYGLPVSHRTYRLERRPAEVKALLTPDGYIMPLKLSIHLNDSPNKGLPMGQKTASLPFTIHVGE
jgi:dihydroorotase